MIIRDGCTVISVQVGTVSYQMKQPPETPLATPPIQGNAVSTGRGYCIYIYSSSTSTDDDQRTMMMQPYNLVPHG